jgi:hypothetical protein
MSVICTVWSSCTWNRRSVLVVCFNWPSAPKAHEKWSLNVVEVANLRPTANQPGRVTTFGQAGWHVIFRPCHPSRSLMEVRFLVEKSRRIPL